MIPGQVEPGDGEVRAGEGAAARRCTSSTPATARSRSARTSTSRPPTRHWSSTGTPRWVCASRSARARACGSSPASSRTSTLVALGGRRVVPGLRLDVADPAGAHRGTPASGWTVDPRGLRRAVRPDRRATSCASPTPTCCLRVEEDRCRGPRGGDEAVFGGGKVIRESMGQARATRAEGAPDLVITGALVLDHWGVVKADIGVRDGRIVGIGKAGNPDTMDGVTPRAGDRAWHRGPRRERQDPHSGRRRLPRPPHQPAACSPRPSASGVTTMIGGGTGPAEGTKATTVTPGAWYLARMFEALDGVPMNVALLGKGNTVGDRRDARAGPRRRERLQGPRGLGRDPGGHRRRPPGGRRDRGAGGAAHRHPQRGRLRRRHARRDRGAEHPRVPHRGGRRRARAGHHHRRRAAARAAVVDQPDAPAHGQHRSTSTSTCSWSATTSRPRSRRTWRSPSRRIRPSTIAAEDLLHDLGAISMIGSDSQAMGRVGEVVLRTWQTAHA